MASLTFLQGPSGIGKSTILRKVFTPCTASATGFVVQGLIENGENIAFRAVCLEDAYPPPQALYHPDLDGVFISRRRWMGFGALEQLMKQVRQKTKYVPSGRAREEVIKGSAIWPTDVCKKLILLDEIGGIEMSSPVFMDSLEQILSGKIPCFGVFKSRENLSRASSNLSLSANYDELQEQHRRLESLICANGEILTVTEQNRNEICSYLQQRLQTLMLNSGKEENEE